MNTLFKHEATKPQRCWMIRMHKWNCLTCPCQRALCSQAIWMKYLIVVWCGRTEEGLCPPRIPLATSCPSALGTSQGDTGHASPLNPPTVALCGKAIALTPSFPSLRAHFLVTGKASLAFRETPLCVALCRRSCASLVGMMRCWEELMLLSLYPPPRCSQNLRPSILWGSLRFMLTWEIVCLQERSTASDSTFATDQILSSDQNQITGTYLRGVS